MDISTALHILGIAERAATISLSVHGLLLAHGERNLARLVLLIHDEATDAAETLGRDLGVEVLEGVDPERHRDPGEENSFAG